MPPATADTVSLAGTPDGLTPRVEGDRLYGRGAYDMKGALAAMMLVVADLARGLTVTGSIPLGQVVFLPTAVLAGAQLVQPVSTLTTVFLIDDSDSVAPAGLGFDSLSCQRQTIV